MSSRPTREALAATYSTPTPEQRAELDALRDRAAQWEKEKDFAAAGAIERDRAALGQHFHRERARAWDAAQS